MNRHTKYRGFIKTAFFRIQRLQDCPSNFDLSFARYVHQLGKQLYPKSPVAQTLFDLYGMGVKKETLPYAYLLIRTFLARKHTSQTEPIFLGLYREFTIPKKNGDVRAIEAPTKKLKQLQRELLPALNFALESLYSQVGDVGVHGFRNERSNISNAAMHTQKTVVVKLDIENFFSSLSRKKIGQAISAGCYHCGLTNINWLTRYFLVEVLSNGRGLPTGAPTSPVLSNICMFSFDYKISALCERHDVSYTRYADDLTLSSDDAKAKKMIGVVIKLLDSLGLKLNYRKTNLQRRGRRQKVCGLVVNDLVSIGRKKRREVRAARHYLLSNKTPHLNGRDITERQLLGHEAYISAVTRNRSS